MNRSRLVVTLVAALLVAGSARADHLAQAEEEMRRAKVAMDQRDYEAAIGHYEAARSLEPGSTGPYLGLGLAFAAQGRCPQAIPFLEEYLRRKPVSPHPSALATLQVCRSQPAPQPPRPQPALWGRVIVVTTPAGAEVRVDDEDDDVRGRTPLDLPLGPGRHRVITSLAGYRDESRWVTVVANQVSSVNVILQPKLPVLTELPRGTLEVTIAPVPGVVSVNGRVLEGGASSQVTTELPAGLYQITVEKPGYETVTRDVWVRLGVASREHVELMSARPREVRRKVGIALGVTLAVGAVAAAVALGVVYGAPAPPTRLMTVQNP